MPCDKKDFKIIDIYGYAGSLFKSNVFALSACVF